MFEIHTNGAEGEVGCGHLALGQHIEERRLADQTSVKAAEKITETNPTLGIPTMPILREVPKRPSIFGSSSSTAAPFFKDLIKERSHTGG
jgi:hypothetical protein